MCERAGVKTQRLRDSGATGIDQARGWGSKVNDLRNRLNNRAMQRPGWPVLRASPDAHSTCKERNTLGFENKSRRWRAALTEALQIFYFLFREFVASLSHRDSAAQESFRGTPSSDGEMRLSHFEVGNRFAAAAVDSLRTRNLVYGLGAVALVAGRTPLSSAALNRDSGESSGNDGSVRARADPLSRHPVNFLRLALALRHRRLQQEPPTLERCRS